ncbi:hypothetical protein MMC07_002726 [Pseudocyphellaria aurata]|nr:hypothetical protein [Pseudocyphellaria aurata]
MDPRLKTLNRVDQQQPGDPVNEAILIVEALTQSGRCKGKELLFRLAQEKGAVEFMNIVLEKAKKILDKWAELSVSTDHGQGI